MKRRLIVCLLVMFSLSLCACQKQEETRNTKPEKEKLQAICELATMECYYHNVAKKEQKDAEGILWWKKDKKIWIEYSGIVVLGVDTSEIDMQIKGNKVSITMPKATVIDSTVDEKSLQTDKYYIENGSAKIDADDQTEVFKTAQQEMEKQAKSDKILLDSAQQRAKDLLSQYIKTLGADSGKEYEIEWIEQEQ